METMIGARFFRAANLILQSENDGGRVSNGQWLHSPIGTTVPGVMRKYLS
jgi:hypothetical protein